MKRKIWNYSWKKSRNNVQSKNSVYCSLSELGLFGLFHGQMSIKTQNSICRPFFKLDLLTDFATLCLNDFIDWRYIHSWLVFLTQLVKCCLHGRRNYTCVLLPLYLLSDLPPSHTKCTEYTDSVWLWWGWGVWCFELCCRPCSAGVYTLFLTRFRTYKITSTPQTKLSVMTSLRDWCL